eukprot:5697195-Ditylum_brightwellii.AAC.1
MDSNGHIDHHDEAADAALTLDLAEAEEEDFKTHPLSLKETVVTQTESLPDNIDNKDRSNHHDETADAALALELASTEDSLHLITEQNHQHDTKKDNDNNDDKQQYQHYVALILP